MDPFQKTLGYPMPQGLRADLITLSHEHPDHDNVRMVINTPKVIHGVTPDKKGWVRVDDKFRDVALRTVGVYHDDKRGTARGLDTVFIFEVGGLRIAHLGDLGHLLDDDELEAIGSVDVLLVPVGGMHDAGRLSRDPRRRSAAPAPDGHPDALPNGRCGRPRTSTLSTPSWNANPTSGTRRRRP